MAESLPVKNGPEEFLRGALEKIVFFECRVSQLVAELSSERAAVLRQKEATAAARAREVELEMLLSQARGSATAMNSRIIELEERVRLLEAEREQFLDGFVERTQVTGVPGTNEGESTGEQTDLAALAGFIAEMREKIEQLKLWKTAAQKAGVVVDEGSASGPSDYLTTISLLADRFEKAGRLSVVNGETNRMPEQFTTRAERSLYESSTEELASADPVRRKRAAECLRVLGVGAALPSITAALGCESDPAVKVELLRALSAVGGSSAAASAIREFADLRPEVRAAALDAAAACAKEYAEPVLLGALGDSSSFVRRRAVLLLGFMSTTAATEALASMVADPDAGVARLAAQALSGRPDVRAQSALTKALNHREPAVRRCAADAVSRWSGETVDPDASPGERRRVAWRITEKLAVVGEGALLQAVVNVPPAHATVGRLSPAVYRKPEPPPDVALPPKLRNTDIIESIIVNHDPEPPAPVPVPGHEPTSLEICLIAEIRTSLRGRTAAELSHLTGAEPADVGDALTNLVKGGSVSQHGRRFFMS